jgi:hypothetical protein
MYLKTSLTRELSPCRPEEAIPNLVGFEVLTVASMKMAIFWVVELCNLVEVYQRFRGSCFLHHQGDP